jgi:D-alanine-D-alanine ligase
MERQIRVGILFGGKSAEHEVSLRSARNVLAAIDTEKYEPILIGIDTMGRWQLVSPERLSSCERIETDADALITLAPEGHGRITSIDGKNTVDSTLDVVFPILHGTFGEDGTVQGLLKLAGVPFVGAGVLGSAVGMDKDVMKRLLRDAGIPVSKFLVCQKKNVPEYEDVIRDLGTPFFVKPANAGSSVGVSKVRTKEEYEEAIREAFLYDQKIIIEENVTGREIECAVLDNDDPMVSVPGEVILHRDFYSYEAKYMDADGASIEIPAKLSAETITEVQAIAIRTFETLCCEGLGRVDLFLKENGDILVNEINTMPGFTSISMYPKLFEASGISYTDLIDRLISLAFERFEKENALKTTH